MMSMSMGRFGGVLPTSTRCALSCSLLACDVPRAPRRRELNSEAEAKAKAKAKERGARKQQAGSRAQEARRRPRAGRAQKSGGSSQHPRQPRLGRCLRPRCRPTERLGGQAPRSESRQSARGRQQHPRPPRLGRCLRHRCRPPTRRRCLHPGAAHPSACGHGAAAAGQEEATCLRHLKADWVRPQALRTLGVHTYVLGSDEYVLSCDLVVLLEASPSESVCWCRRVKKGKRTPSPGPLAT
jgi:hypothetical protein